MYFLELYGFRFGFFGFFDILLVFNIVITFVHYCYICIRIKTGEQILWKCKNKTKFNKDWNAFSTFYFPRRVSDEPNLLILALEYLLIDPDLWNSILKVLTIRWIFLCCNLPLLNKAFEFNLSSSSLFLLTIKNSYKK